MKVAGLSVALVCAVVVASLVCGLLFAPEPTTALLNAAPAKACLLILAAVLIFDILAGFYLAFVSKTPRQAMFIFGAAIIPLTAGLITSCSIAKSGVEFRLEENEHNKIWPKTTLAFGAGEDRLPDYTVVYVYGFMLVFYLMLLFMYCCSHENGGFQLHATLPPTSSS